LAASGIFTKPRLYPNSLICGSLPYAKISIDFSFPDPASRVFLQFNSTFCFLLLLEKACQ
ncbi:hypothetical protein, partial [Aquiflexum sp.]|uniref:hypothetical protein n=1 Tax=Aquiflexum sp. TaxID=1872584 RepID=UPI003593CA19